MFLRACSWSRQRYLCNSARIRNSQQGAGRVRLELKDLPNAGHEYGFNAYSSPNRRIASPLPSPPVLVLYIMLTLIAFYPGLLEHLHGTAEHVLRCRNEACRQSLESKHVGNCLMLSSRAHGSPTLSRTVRNLILPSSIDFIISDLISLLPPSLKPSRCP